MRQVVLDAKHHATAHEPRVWNGEKDSVQAVLQKVPPKVEPRAAPEANPPEAIQARPAERDQSRPRAGRERRSGERRGGDANVLKVGFPDHRL